MLKWLRSLLFSLDDADPSYGRLLRTILASATLGVLLIDGILIIYQPEQISPVYIMLGFTVLVIGALALSIRKIYWPGKLLIPSTLLIGVPFMAAMGNGIHDYSIVGFTAIIVISGLLNGRQAIPLATALVILGVSLVAYRDMQGLTDSFMAVKTGIDDVIVVSLIQVIVAASLSALMSRLSTALQKSQENEKKQTLANDELRELQMNLEDRISQRTLELEQRSRDLSDRTVQLELANIRTQKRAAQLQAISDITRAIATVRSLKELLPRIVNLASERFGFYHVGIFLTDEANQFAILSAANSEGGKKMLARGHRLEVGEQGIVGYVTGFGNPRIALDTGADAVFFNNPDLPETHSEMAIPLKANKRIIGALDIQSEQSNAFAQEDVEVLTTLADQISIAIETARLFESSQKSLAEVESIYRQFLQREWGRYNATEEVIGFEYTVAGAQPLTTRVQSETASQALAAGKVTASVGEEATLAVPIKVRDETIGVLNIRIPRKNTWKQDDIAIAQAIADRVAVSAENARLFEESQRRAEKERTIGQISERISSSVNLENIFRTALQELGQFVPGSEVFVEFEQEQS